MEKVLSTDIIFHTFRNIAKFDKLKTYKYINENINRFICFKLCKRKQKQLIQTICLYCANNSNTNKETLLYDVSCIIARYNKLENQNY